MSRAEGSSAVGWCAHTSSSDFAGRTTASRASAASPALAAGNTNARPSPEVFNVIASAPRDRSHLAGHGPNKVCRFYGNANVDPNTGAQFGPNSHFYTSNAAECAGLKAAYNPKAPAWFFESNDFSITAAVGTGCAAGLTPVYRAYNNGFQRRVDSNHRITSDQDAIAEVVARGWISEGVVMCAPP